MSCSSTTYCSRQSRRRSCRRAPRRCRGWCVVGERMGDRRRDDAAPSRSPRSPLRARRSAGGWRGWSFSRARAAKTPLQPASRQAEEVADRAGAAEGEQGGVDTVLEGAAVVHEMEAEAGSLPRPADLWRGSQTAGTRSRRASSASTEASMRSVLQASGAVPSPRWASASATSQPQSSRVRARSAPRSSTEVAARTGWPRAAKRSESPRRPSSSGGAVVTARLLAALIEQAHVQTLPR